MGTLALQGEWTDASSAAEAAQHYYMQAKIAAESAQRYASSGASSNGAALQGTNLPMPPANMGAPAPGTGIPPEFRLPNASRPPSGRTSGPVLQLKQIVAMSQQPVWSLPASMGIWIRPMEPKPTSMDYVV